MSKDGFSADDIASTFARFADKRRSIVYDEGKLKRKAPEPVAFSSATNECGSSILKVVASIVSNSNKSGNHSDIDDAYDELNSDNLDGWMNGTQGYGYYRNGIKD
ncbi:hypothetical protein [Klebsiella pneumoniae]